MKFFFTLQNIKLPKYKLVYPQTLSGISWLCLWLLLLLFSRRLLHVIRRVDWSGRGCRFGQRSGSGVSRLCTRLHGSAGTLSSWKRGAPAAAAAPTVRAVSAAGRFALFLQHFSFHFFRPFVFSLLFLDVPQHGVHLLAKKHQIFFHHTANFAQHFASFEQFQLVHGVRAPLSRQRHQPIGLVGPQVDLSRAKFLGAGRSMQPHTIFKKREREQGGKVWDFCALYPCGGVKKYLFVYLVRVSCSCILFVYHVPTTRLGRPLRTTTWPLFDCSG